MEIKSTTVTAEHARQWGFKTLASVDNPKASKATKFGFLNAILYMAPADRGRGIEPPPLRTVHCHGRQRCGCGRR